MNGAPFRWFECTRFTFQLACFISTGLAQASPRARSFFDRERESRRGRGFRSQPDAWRTQTHPSVSWGRDCLCLCLCVRTLGASAERGARNDRAAHEIRLPAIRPNCNPHREYFFHSLPLPFGLLFAASFGMGTC